MSSNSQPNVIPMQERVTRLRAQAIRIGGFSPEDAQDICLGLLIEYQCEGDANDMTYQMVTNDEHGKLTTVFPGGWLKKELKMQGAEVGDIIAITRPKKNSSITGHNKSGCIVLIDKGK